MDRRQLREALIDDKLAMVVLNDRRHWDLLPDCEAACGYGTSEEPKLLALCGDSLLILALTPATDGESEKISVEVEPLDRIHAHLRLEQAQIDGALPLRRRRWTIRVNGSAGPLVFETHQRRGAGFHDELVPSGPETLARTLARRLGYAIDDG